MKSTTIVWTAAFLLACGGSDPETSGTTSAEGTSGSESASSSAEDTGSPARHTPGGGSEGEAPDDGMVVEGVLGSLSEQVVRREMDARIAHFSHCFEQRYSDNELLAGSFTFAFRVRQDGTVRHVYLRRSTVGDREVERCLVAAARRVVFSPGPQGGEAEFTHEMAQVVPGELRPPGELSPRRVAALVRADGAATRAACDVEGEGLHVTAYIDARGRVVSVGAAVDAPGQGRALDCVAERVAGWSFPDPGSYDAKTTFDL